MNKNYVASLWDPLCIGDKMFLWLSKNAAKKIIIPSEHLLLEDSYLEFENK